MNNNVIPMYLSSTVSIAVGIVGYIFTAPLFWSTFFFAFWMLGSGAFIAMLIVSPPWRMVRIKRSPVRRAKDARDIRFGIRLYRKYASLDHGDVSIQFVNEHIGRARKLTRQAFDESVNREGWTGMDAWDDYYDDEDMNDREGPDFWDSVDEAYDRVKDERLGLT